MLFDIFLGEVGAQLKVILRLNFRVWQAMEGEVWLLVGSMCSDRQLWQSDSGWGRGFGFFKLLLADALNYGR